MQVSGARWESSHTQESVGGRVPGGRRQKRLPSRQQAEVPGRNRRTDGRGQVEDWETGMRCRSRRTPNRHRSGLTETRKVQRLNSWSGTEGWCVYRDYDKAGRSGTGRVGNWNSIQEILESLACRGGETIWQRVSGMGKLETINICF